MKAFFDLLPVICFFITFKAAGSYTAELAPIVPVSADLIPIVTATAVIIAASLIQMGFIYFKGEKPSKMAIFSTLLVVLFGGMTIAFQDPAFIQWKPTLLYWPRSFFSDSSRKLITSRKFSRALLCLSTPGAMLRTSA